MITKLYLNQMTFQTKSCVNSHILSSLDVGLSSFCFFKRLFSMDTGFRFVVPLLHCEELDSPLTLPVNTVEFSLCRDSYCSHVCFTLEDKFCLKFHLKSVFCFWIFYRSTAFFENDSANRLVKTPSFLKPSSA